MQLMYRPSYCYRWYRIDRIYIRDRPCTKKSFIYRFSDEIKCYLRGNCDVEAYTQTWLARVFKDS